MVFLYSLQLVGESDYFNITQHNCIPAFFLAGEAIKAKEFRGLQDFSVENEENNYYLFCSMIEQTDYGSLNLTI